MNLSREQEKILMHQNGVATSKNKSPSIRGSKGGDLILTNKRLVLIKCLHLWSVETYKTIEELEEKLRTREDSFEIPLINILKAERGSSWLGPYFAVTYQTALGPKFRCFSTNKYFNTGKWVKNISALISSAPLQTKKEAHQDFLMIETELAETKYCTV